MPKARDNADARPVTNLPAVLIPTLTPSLAAPPPQDEDLAREVRLLELCEQAIHHNQLRRDAIAGLHAANALPGQPGRAGHSARHREHRLAMRKILNQARRIRARTGAGVYAKALLIRSSATDGVSLAQSLAEDILACPALRLSLWPAQVQP